MALGRLLSGLPECGGQCHVPPFHKSPVNLQGAGLLWAEIAIVRAGLSWYWGEQGRGVAISVWHVYGNFWEECHFDGTMLETTIGPPREIRWCSKILKSKILVPDPNTFENWCKLKFAMGEWFRVKFPVQVHTDAPSFRRRKASDYLENGSLKSPWRSEARAGTSVCWMRSINLRHVQGKGERDRP